MLERAHLVILREVERQGSLTAAADKLHLTQSALSHAIKKLEQQAGTAVWTREGRALRLTQAGEYLLAVARRLLPQLEYADEVVRRIARGEKGHLRIGMECHPCYRWLLKVVEPYLERWPAVDLDVKQQFQFGGMAALFNYDIDILVTPDPLHRPGVSFVPVFDYEQVLVVAADHPLAARVFAEPADLAEEVLFTYPVELERLDVYADFLLPAQCRPKKHKIVEATDIMLQMVAAGRGVAALPRWLVEEYAVKMPVRPLRLGASGIAKQIFLGVRDGDEQVEYLRAFVELAANTAGRVCGEVGQEAYSVAD
ncbi:LysR family transcriptional regulator [Marinobacterium nitratireducens]|uniref:HTH-type transcriptional regulator MetR n=1 Tax=Marinobacterium nitratireducens TaxID=518897 RepID=A0A917ZN02_9GAMM|nr:LysR family transcriptional regulator [Marinobacterium nitratireducens]GGO86650.1 LysR family transcriptional regulator [Marinobacterium nitratireducens]